MFDRSHMQQAKQKTMVEIETVAGKIMIGEIFLAQGQRLADALNDTRGFLPVESVDGVVFNIAKSTIAMARAVAEPPKAVTDPYAILRVQRGASFQEVREAWMKRVKACHPDRLESLDLEEEIIYEARRVTQRLNNAYDTVVQDLKDAAAEKLRAEKQEAREAQKSQFGEAS